MKHIPNVIGGLLGLVFIAAAVVYFVGVAPEEGPPAGSVLAMFMEALAITGYLTFVKILELVGGVLVAIPRLRNLGLLILGPILLNIVAVTIFLQNWDGFFPVLAIICLMALYLLWVERRAFAGLVRRGS